MSDAPQRPSDEETPVNSDRTPDIVEEMAAIPYEPLLPVEKKLIAWSLALGVVLLIVLGWVSHTFFPVDHLGG